MSLDDIAKKHGTDKSSISHNYTKYYELLFSPIQNQRLKIIEIGIASGASLRMWKEYFPLATIYGIDVSLGYKKYEEERINVIAGDQNNSDFLKTLYTTVGECDIIIDDGSHVSKHQVTSFTHLFPLVKAGGYYVIEDLHTSYLKNFLLDSPLPTTDFLKNLVDDMNMRGKSQYANKNLIVPHLKKQNISLNYYEETIESIMFFPSICFIKKLGA